VKNKQQMDQFCEEKGFIGWSARTFPNFFYPQHPPNRPSLLLRFETSAKENLNIDKACRYLVQHILENDISAAKDEDKDILRPSDAPTSTAKQGGCC